MKGVSVNLPEGYEGVVFRANDEIARELMIVQIERRRGHNQKREDGDGKRKSSPSMRMWI